MNSGAVTTGSAGATASAEAARASVVAAAREMARLRLAPATSGNVSMRSGDRIFVTPTRTAYGCIEPAAVVEVDAGGTPVWPYAAPSLELPLHLAVYAVRADIGAIVHTHSAFATACAMLGLPLVDTEERSYYAFNRVGTVAYAPAGSAELASRCAAAARDADVLLLKHHGVVALARDAESAVALAAAVEHVAHVTWLVATAGKHGAVGPKRGGCGGDDLSLLLVGSPRPLRS